MANFDLIPVVANALQATPAITSVLPDGASGIIPAFNLIGDSFPINLNLPCIVLKDGGTYGTARDMPFMQTTIMVSVYDTVPSPNHVSYARISQLLWECVKALDKTNLATNASYYGLFEVQFDAYMSGELFDDRLKLPFRTARFRAFIVTNIRN